MSLPDLSRLTVPTLVAQPKRLYRIKEHRDGGIPVYSLALVNTDGEEIGIVTGPNGPVWNISPGLLHEAAEMANLTEWELPEDAGGNG